MAEQQRILGIDPGSRLTGFGVLDFVGDKATYVASGSIASAKGEFADRLKLIFRSVSEIVAEYQIDSSLLAKLQADLEHKARILCRFAQLFTDP